MNLGQMRRNETRIIVVEEGEEERVAAVSIGEKMRKTENRRKTLEKQNLQCL